MQSELSLCSGDSYLPQDARDMAGAGGAVDLREATHGATSRAQSGVYYRGRQYPGKGSDAA